MGIMTNRKFRRGKLVPIQQFGNTGHGPRRRGDESEQQNPASNGRGLIDDFRLRGARWCRQTNAPPKKPRWRTEVAGDINHPNAFLSEGRALAVVVEGFPETPQQPRRCRFLRHRGLRHGSGRRERRE